MDEDSELIYLRARLYDTRLGRFISRDPMKSNILENLYFYANGNPVMYFDLSGTYYEPIKPIRLRGISNKRNIDFIGVDYFFRNHEIYIETLRYKNNTFKKFNVLRVKLTIEDPVLGNSDDGNQDHTFAPDKNGIPNAKERVVFDKDKAHISCSNNGSYKIIVEIWEVKNGGLSHITLSPTSGKIYTR